MCAVDALQRKVNAVVRIVGHAFELPIRRVALAEKAVHRASDFYDAKRALREPLTQLRRETSADRRMVNDPWHVGKERHNLGNRLIGSECPIEHHRRL